MSTMIRDSSLHLVYNSDNNYLLPTFVSAASAIYHSSCPQNLAIDILDCGISDAKWKHWSELLRSRFPSLGSIRRIGFDPARILSFQLWKGSFATYARILTPELLPDVDRCLFVDGDTLFVSDPFELTKVYDQSYWIQGSVDYAADGIREEVYKRYGLHVPSDYVCCGLMLMNLEALRRNLFVVKCLDFLSRYKDLPAVDQEAINCVCSGHMSRLDPAWGVFNQCAFREVLEPKCVHYVNGKPWLLSFNWTHCLFDMERAWFLYSKKLLGLKLKDLPGVSLRQYAMRRIITALMFVWKPLKGDRCWRQRYFYHGERKVFG